MKEDQMSIMEKTRGQKGKRKRLIALAPSTILSKIKGFGYTDSCRVRPLTGLCPVPFTCDEADIYIFLSSWC